MTRRMHDFSDMALTSLEQPGRAVMAAAVIV
jgi:hypothetical protein